MSELLLAIAQICAVHWSTMRAYSPQDVQSIQRKCVSEIFRCANTNILSREHVATCISGGAVREVKETNK